MSRHLWHRWSAWKTEFEECPDGWMGVWEYQSRTCLSKGCGAVEEEAKGCVSSSPEVVREGG